MYEERGGELTGRNAGLAIDQTIQPGSTLYELVMQAPAIICVMRGPDHIFELVNPGYEELFKGRKLVGRPAREALSDLDPKWFEILDNVYNTGKPYVGREARVVLDHREGFFNFIYQPMRTGGGRVEGIIVVAFEVTGEIRARDEAEEQFRLLVDAVKDYAIFMLDPDGRIMSWNSGARRIKGYDQHEIMGRHFSIFYPQEDVRDGKPERNLGRARELGRFEDEGWRVRKDGTRFWADVVISAVYDAEGVLRGYVKVTRDMTERRRAEEAERALAVAQRVNQQKDEFLATVSHELRTPLTSILGWARMLRIGGLEAETTREALEAIERSAQAQVHLIEDLLDDARIASGKLRLDKRPLEIRPVVESALADLGPAAEARKIRIVADLGCEPCPVIGDPTRLQQVIWNLVSNSIKFTPEGGEVFVNMMRRGPRLQIDVRDNGHGIAPDLLPQLFQRLRQGDASSARKSGLGLGLAITRYLVEQHGGTITAASEGAGKGATFTVSLPMAEKTSEEFATRGSTRDERLPDLSGLRVLIVEDEADNREVLSTVMRRCGAEVQWSGNAHDALSTLERWSPQVIICDVALPGMDGCAFMQTVRARLATPALALTVFGSAEQESRIRECGFDVFRQKPIEPADLAHDVARLARPSS